MKRLALDILFASLLAALGLFLPMPLGALAQDTSVQSYYNQSAPPLPPPSDSVVPYDSPLTAGQMTLQDVLRAHPKKPAATPLLAPPAINPSPVANTPTQPATAPSSANLMLMQGMQSALQENGAPPIGNGRGPGLKAPQIQAATPLPAIATAPPQAITAAEAAGAIAVPSSSAALENAVANAPTSAEAAGFHYQPGQEPRNLATGQTFNPASPTSISVAPGMGPNVGEAASGPLLSESTDGAMASSGGTTIESSSGPPDASGCVPRTAAWTKNCADAGYPDNYVGHIKGQTQTVCPGSVMKDVWIENNCSPPEGSDNAPLSAPTPGMAAGAASTLPASLEISNAMAQQIPPTRGDASCGAANGLAAASKPVGDLCASGQPTDVSGTGPWRWSCNGAKGGMTVSCAAPVAANAMVNASVNTAAAAATTGDMALSEDGVCGGAAAIGNDHAPVANLCAHGMASRVSGTGPWTWACSGLNGGQAAACEAPLRADGVCGTSNGAAADQMPTADLCSEGFASAVTGNGPWNWTCSGLNGGSAATCSAAPRQNAVCGQASLSGHQHAPDSNLCSVGQPSVVSGSGPWAWSCDGSNGGASVACTAQVSENGACGNANGAAFNHAPNSELCARGTPTRVTGAGPWSWNCEGNDGGNTESCTALPRDTRYDTAANNNAAASPASANPEEAAPPAAAPVAAVTKPAKPRRPKKPVAAPAETPSAPAIEETISSSTAPAGPSPTPAAGTSATIAPSAEHVTGRLCGSAAELMAIEAPDHDLCESGSAGPISGDGPFSWICTDDKGSTSHCSTLAPAGSLSDVIPSAATSASTSSPPSAAPPMPSDVAPVDASSAGNDAPEAVAPVAANHASCGLSAGRGAAQAPADNLCAVGKSSSVHGSGPWHWTCSKGRDKVNCDAPVTSDGVCGAVNGSLQKYAPSSGLCAGGTPTQVQGTGPWLWTCVGSGGGASVSCSAASQAQTRVDGSCGVAATNASASLPISNLCDSGVASNVYGDGPWTWTCSGLNGGVASSCSSQKSVPSAPPPPGPALNGLCGAANGVAATTQPADGLCSTGTVTAVSGNGPWNWNCLGENGGMTVSCTAPLQPPAPITGVCGAASGISTLTTPRSGLCAAGISSAVSGHGPWTWSCSGTNGGGAVGCVAPLASAGGTGALPSLVTPSDMGEAPLPQAAMAQPVAKSTLVTPRLAAGSLPPLRNEAAPIIPSDSFPSAPQPTAMPSEPMPSDIPSPPPSEPDLPSGTTPLTPPPIRDTIQPSPALRPSGLDSQGMVIPGNHFVLDQDISSIPFRHGSENVDASSEPALDKLAGVLRGNSGVRITLTAYADAAGSTPREARRLSLTRALAIRDYLTAHGVSSSRVDVRALGANVDSGDADRVDIKAN